MKSQLPGKIRKRTRQPRNVLRSQGRGILLERFVVITAIFNFVLILANLWMWSSAKSRLDLLHIYTGITGFFILGGIWLLNKRGLTTSASVLLIVIYITRIAVVLSPERFPNALWGFIIPVILSAFILRPVSSFISAGISAILYLSISFFIGVQETLDITLFKLFLLISVAILSYFVATHLDRAARTVRRSDAKYQDLFINLPIGLYQTSPEGKILDVNPAFLEMFGFTSLDEIKNIHAQDLYADPKSRNKHLSIVEKRTTTEMLMRRSDGTHFWVTDHVRPIVDPKGNVVQYEGSLIDISVRKKAEEELEQQAITDSLTGLPNRRYFFSKAEQAIKHAQKQKGDLAVLMIDLDHFKQINDRYGHSNGDVVLKEVAQIIQEHLRTNDTSARYGGEEFSVLFSRITREEVCQIADRLCKSVSTAKIELNKKSVSVTMSIGISIIDPSTTSLDVLLNRADQALYSAKQSGRNCWRLWEKA